MRTFGKVLVAIFDGIAKAVSFVFGTLGLWLPTVYTVIFLTVCGFTDKPIEGKTAILFYTGLALCAVGGFALSMYLRAVKKSNDPSSVKKKNKKGEVATQNTVPQSSVPPQNVKHNSVPPQYNGQYNVPPQYGNSAQYNGQYNAPPQYGNSVPPQYNGQYNVPPQYGSSVPPQYNGQYNVPPQYGSSVPPQYNGQYNAPPQYGAPTQPQNNADLEKKYFSGGESAPQRYERTVSFDSDDAARAGSEERERSTEYSLGTDELWRRLTGSDVPDEQPLVFRTRRDPDLYVYEYSDRYQYWRRTDHGMVFEQTEYKRECNPRG